MQKEAESLEGFKAEFGKPKPQNKMKNPQKKKEFFKLIYEDQQFEQFIKEKLIKISKKAYQFRDLMDLLQKFKFITWVQRSYYTKKGKTGKFNNFDALFKVLKGQENVLDFFSKISRYILEMEKKNINPIPIFRTGVQGQHTFKKSQLLLILCMMAMFLIPVQNHHKNINLQPRFSQEKDFSSIFSKEKYKAQCVVQFIANELNKIFTNNKQNESQTKQQNLTMKKIVVQESIQQLLAKKGVGEREMVNIKIEHDKANIQDFIGYLKVDFANKFIGGGALTDGNVQQQIMFANRPQLYVSQLIHQVTQMNESIVFVGFKKYFINHGYGWTLKYGGPQDLDKLYKGQLDSMNRVKQYIVAIDALKYQNGNIIDQFKADMINRELIKAYTGFSFGKQDLQYEKLEVATGNWGCGVFNGKHHLKILIQWIAASMNGKSMVYCPFGFHNKLNDLKLLSILSKKSPKQVHRIVLKAAEKVKDSNCNFYAYVDQVLKEEQAKL